VQERRIVSTLPRRPRGRLSAANEAVYCAQVSDFCETINAIRETLDFKVSSRGWCYILEEKIGLLKGDFDRAQDLINDSRKNGLLPLDICAEDETRSTLHLPLLDDDTPVQYERGIVNRIQWAHLLYEPFCIWDDLPVYVEYHPDHFKPYVQNYVKRFGARKVEANALVVRPDAGRELCRRVVREYVPADDDPGAPGETAVSSGRGATASPEDAGGRSVIVLVVSLAGYTTRGPVYDGMMDRATIVTRPTTPFFDAARVLLAKGVAPDMALVMRHAGAHHDALRSTVGKAAGLSVENSGGKPAFRPYKPDGRFRAADGSPMRFGANKRIARRASKQPSPSSFTSTAPPPIDSITSGRLGFSDLKRVAAARKGEAASRAPSEAKSRGKIGDAS
jgi:hypothetical protein